MAASVLQLYRKYDSLPFGKWLFSQLVCWKAPYFSGISPRILVLEPGRGEARIAHRRGVTNHFGTVHAIAMCNLAEFIGGLTTDVSIPASMRWIPRGMAVEYLKKARGTLHAVATFEQPPRAADEGYALPARIEITDPAGETVCRAIIDMWVSPRRTS